MKQKNSFSRRLTVNILLAFGAIFLVALLVAGIWSHKLIAEEAIRSTENELHATISDMDITINTVEISAEAIALNLLALQGEEAKIPELIKQVVSRSEIIDGCAVAYCDGDQWHLPLCLTDSTGAQVLYPLEESDFPFRQQPWFNIPAQSLKPYWSDPHIDSAITPISHTSYSYPIITPQGQLYAILIVSIPLQWIETQIAAIKPYPHARAFMRCSDSTFIGVEKEDFAVSEQLKDNSKGFQSIEEGMRSGRDSMGRFAFRSHAAFAVYGPLQNGWSLAIVCSYAEVLQRTSQMHLVLILIGLAGLLLMAIVCHQLIRHLTSPLRQLSHSALEMAEGNFQASLPEIGTQDEMEQLRDAFASMQQNLDNYIDELKSTTALNERMESELNVARKIQMGMLSTQFPPQLHAFLEPAREVGGDLYDFQLRDNKLYIAIGDVSGKGVPASLMMAITKASLRFVNQNNHHLSDAVSQLNNTIAEANKLDLFVTLFVARIDLVTGTMDYCNAGHNPILVIPPSNAPYLLKALPNLAVGLFSNYGYQEQQQTLEKGGRLVLYTDGVTEAENANKELFGNDRLLDWAAHLSPTMSNQEVTDSLYQKVKEFANGNEQNDDITIMTLTL